jgi:hypothetical protein
MKIRDLFSQLSYGELGNLSIGGDGSGVIAESDHGKIIHHTQQALTNLYSRFSNRKSYLVLQQSEAIKTYSITPAHYVDDVTVGNTLPRYIIDSDTGTFATPIIKILSVREIGEDGKVSAENLLTKEGGLRTPSYNEIYIQAPTDGTYLAVEVQMNHPTIPLPVDLDYEISLAPVLEEALVLKVSSRVYGSMNGQENMVRSQALNAGYEGILQIVQFEDLLQLTENEDQTRFEIGGWK